MFRLICLILCCLFSMCFTVIQGNCGALSISLENECRQIQEYANRHFAQSGVLKQDEAGFVYVDIDNNYIFQLLPFIEKKGYQIPPYFKAPLGHGAHVSVIYQKEAHKFCIPRIQEAGATITFKIVSCKEVFLSQLENVASAIILEVQAPFLDRIRKKYGLMSPHYPYHITVGVKPKKKVKAA